MTRKSVFVDSPKRRRSGMVRRSMVLDSNNLGRRVVSGSTYTFLGIFLRTAMTIGSTAVLARLLTPADFGYIAMATVVTELAALFGNFGFSSVLIQRRVVARLHLDTVFWASLMLGVMLTLAVFALSFLAGTLFGDPLTGELLRLLCLTFFIGGLTSVQGVILSRLMLFRVSFWIGIGAVAIRIAVAISFALQGYGVWSLVAGSIAGSLAGFVFGMAFVPYWPRLRFSRGYIISIWRTSSSYFGGGVLFYVSSNVDLFLIGRELGATTLGIYQNARSLTDEVRSRIAVPLQRVLFPAFSALLNERQRLQQSVVRSGRLLSAIIFPIAVGVSSVSEELVPLLYGPQWGGMIPVLKLLGLSAALRGSTAISTPIFNSSNRAGLALIYNLIGTVLLVSAVLLAIPAGIVAVATAIALMSLYSLITLRAALQLIGLDAKAMGSMLGAPALASAIAWVVIAALRAVGAEWSAADAIQLVGYVAVGALVYAVALVALSPQYVADLRALAGNFRKSA